MPFPVSTSTQGNQHSALSAWIGLPILELHMNRLLRGLEPYPFLICKGADDNAMGTQNELTVNKALDPGPGAQ